MDNIKNRSASWIGLASCALYLVVSYNSQHNATVEVGVAALDLMRVKRKRLQVEDKLKADQKITTGTGHYSPTGVEQVPAPGETESEAVGAKIVTPPELAEVVPSIENPVLEKDHVRAESAELSDADTEEMRDSNSSRDCVIESASTQDG